MTSTAAKPLIKQLDISGQQAEIWEEARELVERAALSGAFVGGEELSGFEREFADYCGTARAVGVGSGTAALHLGLIAAGLQPGDEVILPANTFFADVEAVRFAGGVPVLVDVREEDFNIDPAGVADALTDRTRAVIAVHLYGRPADVDAIRDAVGDRPVALIEDACQAHGARRAGRRVGGLGTLGAFSFYPSKNLGAWGEGGCVTTDDPEIAESVASLRAHGERERYTHERVGLNERLDALQAGVLRLKLRRLDDWNGRRREVAGMYRELLAGGPALLPSEPSADDHVYHHFIIRVAERDRFRDLLMADGVGTGIHYPIPLHRQPGIDPANAARPLPVTTRLANEIVSLPMHPHLADEDVARVAESVLRHAIAPH